MQFARRKREFFFLALAGALLYLYLRWKAYKQRQSANNDTSKDDDSSPTLTGVVFKVQSRHSSITAPSMSHTISSSPETPLNFALVFHGGAGNISRQIDPTSRQQSLSDILKKSYEYCLEAIEADNATALDIAEKVVVLLEDNPHFNAGIGSVYTSAGTHELEASVMDGNLRCGAVALTTHIKNPIKLARDVMNHTKHVMMVGEGAENLIETEPSLKDRHDIVDNKHFDTQRRYKQLLKAQDKARTKEESDEKERSQGNSNVHSEASLSTGSFNTGTVGCVVMLNNEVASATSTGGKTNKLVGRIGDTPIIGAGTYACNRTCAVSGTGVGEEFQRHCSAYDIHARMEYLGMTIQEAMETHVDEKFNDGTGGLIGVDSKGNIGVYMNSQGMFRGWLTSEGLGYISIWEEQIRVNFD